MLEALQQYEFLRNALAAILLGSISCGIVGTLVVVNRLSALAGGVAHACFGGLGLSYLLGAPPTAGALAFGLASALGIGAASSRWREAADAAIAAIWAGGMALGLVFIQLAPGYAPDLMSYLFGSVLAVPAGDLLLFAAVDAGVLLFVLLLYRSLVAVSFDPEFGRTRGLRADSIFLAFLCLVAITIVLLMRAVGLLLVIALLAIPPSTVRLFAHRLPSMMVFSCILTALEGVIGLAVAWELNIPAGASIILVAGMVYVLAAGARSLQAARKVPAEA
jgi:zinc transport system permease protein